MEPLQQPQQQQQQFCLRWNNHQNTLISVFDSLLESGSLTDCALAAEGQCLNAHKVVLSACSPYFAVRPFVWLVPIEPNFCRPRPPVRHPSPVDVVPYVRRRPARTRHLLIVPEIGAARVCLAAFFPLETEFSPRLRPLAVYSNFDVTAARIGSQFSRSRLSPQCAFVIKSRSYRLWSFEKPSERRSCPQGPGPVT